MAETKKARGRAKEQVKINKKRIKKKVRRLYYVYKYKPCPKYLK